MSQQDTQRFRTLGPNTSVLLDVVRFTAACVVAISHVAGSVQAIHPFTGPSANAAVCVFFVLSGFVIRFVTVSRKSTASDYWLDRASRIYSVVVPAILLTVLFEAFAFLHNPVFYRWFAQPYSWKQVPWQIVTNLTFTSGYWGYGTAPLSNLPFWSLTFECVYYVLYGLLYYTRTLRWFLVPLILLLVGPSIALLFPVWWMGVLLFDACTYLNSARRGRSVALLFLLLGASAAISLRHQIVRVLHQTDVNWRRAQAGHIASSVPLLHHSALAAVPWFDRLSVSFYFTGAVFSLLLLFLVVFLDRSARQVSKAFTSRVRVVADSTFTLYLLHVPLLILMFSFLGRPVRTAAGAGVVLLIAVLISIVLAMQFDELKVWLRSNLRALFSRAGTRWAIAPPGSPAFPSPQSSSEPSFHSGATQLSHPPEPQT